jgi:hypothetical protein
MDVGSKITEFITKVIPEMYPDQIETMIVALNIELLSPRLKDQRKIHSEIPVEIQEDQLANDLRKQRMKIIQEDIMELVPRKGITEQSIIDGCREYGHSTLDTKGQLEVLISKGEIIVKNLLYFSQFRNDKELQDDILRVIRIDGSCVEEILDNLGYPSHEIKTQLEVLVRQGKITLTNDIYLIQTNVR